MAYNGGFVDAIGINPNLKKEKITVCEIKATRADLLADLRQQKLLKYEKFSTYCYLCCSSECFSGSTNKEKLKDLSDKGLPIHWGVMDLTSMSVIRPARKINVPDKRVIFRLTKKLAISHMWRLLKHV